MTPNWCKFTASAVIAGALSVGAMSTSAEAGSLILGNSGWKASWDSSFDDAAGTFVTLTVLAETSDSVVLQKVAVFADGPDEFGLISPIEINFEQTNANAVTNIVIAREIVTNATGTDWSGFKMIIEDGNTGTTADVHYDIAETFGPPTPFDADPFDVTDIISNNGGAGVPQTLVFGDGVVANGEIWRPGFSTDAGDIFINGAPSATGNTRFVFKEQPIPGVPIPLPAAAWTSLSGLVALGAVHSMKALRRRKA